MKAAIVGAGALGLYYGALLQRSGVTFKNSSILLALEMAADRYHECHVKGGVVIEYGNSNYHMSNAGMTTTDDRGVLHPQLAEAVPSLANGLWKVLADGTMETTWRIRPRRAGTSQRARSASERRAWSSSHGVGGATRLQRRAASSASAKASSHAVG